MHLISMITIKLVYSFSLKTKETFNPFILKRLLLLSMFNLSLKKKTIHRDKKKVLK